MSKKIPDKVGKWKLFEKQEGINIPEPVVRVTWKHKTAVNEYGNPLFLQLEKTKGIYVGDDRWEFRAPYGFAGYNKYFPGNEFEYALEHAIEWMERHQDL